MQIKQRTAEFVSPKHPDKMCDIISDSILDFYLKRDKNSRVAVETLGGHGKVIIMGEVTSKANLEKKDLGDIVKKVTGKKFKLDMILSKQSPCIAQGVDTGGAGDQGIMVGYACDETKDLMPLEYSLARDLCKYLYCGWDGKTQVTVKDNIVKTILASFQNSKNIQLMQAIRDWTIIKGIEYPVEILTNPAGEWDIGGFDADTGLTGRKIVVDAYGPRVPVGGGAFSGKDPSKVDRSGAYIARKIAVDILKETKAKEALVNISYAIGVAQPVMANIEITEQDGETRRWAEVTGDKLMPRNIIKNLGLLNVEYGEVAQWGHFGNNFNWDREDVSKT